MRNVVCCSRLNRFFTTESSVILLYRLSQFSLYNYENKRFCMRFFVSNWLSGRKNFDNSFVFGSIRFRPKIWCRSVIDFQYFSRLFINVFLYVHEVFVAAFFQLFKFLFSINFSEFFFK